MRRPRALALLTLRCLLVGGFLACGLGGMGYLSDAQRTAGNKLQVNDFTFRAAVSLAWVSFPVMAGISLIGELLLPIIIACRVTPRLLQLLLPLLAALLGALLAWDWFPQEKHGPKETMLLAWGAWLFFLGATLQLALWQQWQAPPEWAVDPPAAWYVVLILIGATFLGALKGWTDIEPKVRKLLRYRARNWNAQRPPPEFRPIEDPWTN